MSLLAHEPFDVASLAERLQLDLSRVRLDVVGPAPEAVTAASADLDLFVNASYASDLPSAAAHSLYVVHFPVAATDRPGRARRLLAGAGRQMAARLTRGVVERTQVVRPNL